MSASETPSPTEVASGVQCSADAVINRMRDAWSVSTDSALADRLHTARQSVSKWRSRNSIPYAEAVFTSNFRQVSLDWLLKGEGERQRTPQRVAAIIDFEIIRASLMSLVGMGIITLRSEHNVDEALEELTICAKAIANGYARAIKTAELLTQENHMTAVEARRVAISAAELVSSNGELFGPRPTPGTLSKRR